MDIRHHLAHHDPGDSPLVTESAVVTGRDPLDRNRTEEVIATLDAVLLTHGTAAYADDTPDDPEERRHWLRDRLDARDHVEEAGGMDRYLPDAARDAAAGEAVRSLQARYLRPYPSLLSLSVDPAEPIAFDPGQYLSLRYQDVTRPYSIASPVGDDTLEFCIRRVPGGRLTPTLIDQLVPDTELTVRGPYGELTLQESSTRDVVFLATGTGVAPFRSMILSLFAAGEDVVDDVTRDVWLFLGARWADDLPYHAAFADLAEDRENFHYVPTLSRESLLTDWGGETAYVQYVLANHVDPTSIKGSLPEAFADALESDPVASVDERLDPEEMDVYACGVTAMVTSLVDAVEALGVPEERTEFEAFG
ncbi:MAG: ferredoxin--NADP reductase [Halobacteriaceae archaeon]